MSKPKDAKEKKPDPTFRHCWGIPEDFEPQSQFDLPDEREGIPLKTLKEVGDIFTGRYVIDVSMHLGTYGMGGAGFIGLKFSKTEVHEEQWLVFRTWGAEDWLLLDNKPMGSTGTEDKFREVVGKTFKVKKLNSKSFIFIFGGKELKIWDHHIMSGIQSDRKFNRGEDLRDAFVVSPTKYIVV